MHIRTKAGRNPNNANRPVKEVRRGLIFGIRIKPSLSLFDGHPKKNLATVYVGKRSAPRCLSVEMYAPDLGGLTNAIRVAGKRGPIGATHGVGGSRLVGNRVFVPRTRGRIKPERPKSKQRRPIAPNLRIKSRLYSHTVQIS